MVNPNENRLMFDSIAKGYDLTNKVITLGNLNRIYKRLVTESKLKPGDSLIDCATGTGNVAIIFQKYFGNSLEIKAIDVADEMLGIGIQKSKDLNLSIDFINHDILDLPFDDNAFSASTIAYGIRNVASVENCIKEMARVVKCNGYVLILETGSPAGFKKNLYSLYQKTFVIPAGKIITGNTDAYKYFTESSNNFPAGSNFLEIMNVTGSFSELRYRSFMFGTVYLYIGKVR